LDSQYDNLLVLNPYLRLPKKVCSQGSSLDQVLLKHNNLTKILRLVFSKG
jgi:hypothetical protein